MSTSNIAAPKGESVNVPLWKIWNLLRPSWKEIWNGELECVGMLAISCVQMVEIRFKTRFVQLMDTTLVSRDLAAFKFGLKRWVVLALAGAWMRIIYGYTHSRLSWKWKKKLTDLVHDKYFGGINYYLIGEGGGRGVDKMADADVRITEDLRQTVDGFSRSFSDVMYSSTTGVFYTFEIWRLFGWKYAIAPYAYLFGAFGVVDFLAPVMKRWRRNGRFRGQSWGSYRNALTRLMLQCESVASLKGAAYEHKIIRDEYAIHRHDISIQHRDYFRFGIVNCFFMHHFLDQFVAIFCIGRGILYPMYEKVDTIQKMTDVRILVGVQVARFYYYGSRDYHIMREGIRIYH
jgi:ABC-type uncharacterized transport system fused permease/ATPase subunit